MKDEQILEREKSFYFFTPTSIEEEVAIAEARARYGMGGKTSKKRKGSLSHASLYDLESYDLEGLGIDEDYYDDLWLKSKVEEARRVARESEPAGHQKKETNSIN